MSYEGKKILAILAMTGTVLLGSPPTSEAHNIVITTDPIFTFSAENFSLNSHDKFNYVESLRFRCTRCGKEIVYNGNPNDPNSSIAYGCPAKDGDPFFGDKHIWRYVGLPAGA
ncbi:MAG: hypothetical protein IJQ82_12785 [Selenomonadaceae bacterium]|nr:hypothetical protein [Selenomonadaceae bacterium]